MIRLRRHDDLNFHNLLSDDKYKKIIMLKPLQWLIICCGSCYYKNEFSIKFLEEALETHFQLSFSDYYEILDLMQIVISKKL